MTIFEPTEHALDDVALSANFGVAIKLDFAVLFERDDSGYAPLYAPFAQVVTVISFVSDRFGRARHSDDTLLGALPIMHIFRGYEQNTGAPFHIADGVDLGVPTPGVYGRYHWPSAPFCASSSPVWFDADALDEQPVWNSLGSCKCAKDALPDPALGPADEPVVKCLLWTIDWRTIAPAPL